MGKDDIPGPPVSEPLTPQSPMSDPPPPRIETGPIDLTGRSRLLRNVLTSWGGYIVFIIGGFIVPPIIDRKVGQAGLGLWDFAWNLVAYFGIAQVGIGSSVNRYVAKHRAVHDVAGLRRVTSSTMILQLGVALLVTLFTVAATWGVPHWFGAQLGEDVGRAQVLVALLGLSLAVQMAFDLYRGVITGCHRWDLHNALAAGSYAVQVIANITVLMLGYGIVGLGAATLVITILTELFRARLAHRVCPEMRVSLSLFDREQAKETFAYGLKTSLVQLSSLILIQGNSLMVTATNGVAQLALYARPWAIMRHAESLVDKFAFVLTPTASSLQGRGDMRAVRELLFSATRTTAYFVVPLMMSFAILGDDLLWAWMGPAYSPHGYLVAALALGNLLGIVFKPVWAVLAGLNRHGQFAKQSLAAAATGLGLSYLFTVRLGWGLTGAALAVSLARTVFVGTITPVAAARVLHFNVFSYYKSSLAKPFLYCAPYVIGLFFIHYLPIPRPWGMLAVAAAWALVSLIPLYWLFALDASLRAKIRARVGLAIE